MPKTILHDLHSGLVLDRSVLVDLSSEEISQVIAGIRAAGAKPLYVVPGAEAFFTTQTLMSLMAAKDKRYVVVNEALGGFFTQPQIDALLGAPGMIAPQGAVKMAAKPVVGADLIVNLGAQAHPAPLGGGYEFAPVPAGWSISGNMSLGQTKIKRKVKNSDGDGILFFMSPGDFEKLWLFASKAWAGVEDAPISAKFNTGVGVKLANIQDDRISLGGNCIRRYEIEQVAKYRNWAIPGVAAVAAQAA